MDKLIAASVLQYEITRFYYLEASLLDKRRYEDWLNLLTEDIIYRMPLRVTREKKDGSNIVEDMAFFEEDMMSLKLRVQRFGTSSAWSDDPAPRTRHYISNVIIEPGSSDDELSVQCCFLFTRNRGDSPRNDQISGERLDVIRKIGDTWKIAERTIYADQVVIGTLHLNSFL